jgi:hypothetical protein
MAALDPNSAAQRPIQRSRTADIQKRRILAISRLQLGCQTLKQGILKFLCARKVAELRHRDAAQRDPR